MRSVLIVRKKSLMSVLSCLVALFGTECGGTSVPSAPPAQLVTIEDPESPVIAMLIDQTGVLSAFGIKDEAGKVLMTTGGVFAGVDGNRFAVAFGPDGRPARFDFNGTEVNIVEYGWDHVSVWWSDGEDWHLEDLPMDRIRQQRDKESSAHAKWRVLARTGDDMTDASANSLQQLADALADGGKLLLDIAPCVGCAAAEFGKPATLAIPGGVIVGGAALSVAERLTCASCATWIIRQSADHTANSPSDLAWENRFEVIGDATSLLGDLLEPNILGLASNITEFAYNNDAFWFGSRSYGQPSGSTSGSELVAAPVFLGSSPPFPPRWGAGIPIALDYSDLVAPLDVSALAGGDADFLGLGDLALDWDSVFGAPIDWSPLDETLNGAGLFPALNSSALLGPLWSPIGGSFPSGVGSFGSGLLGSDFGSSSAGTSFGTGFGGTTSTSSLSGSSFGP